MIAHNLDEIDNIVTTADITNSAAAAQLRRDKKREINEVIAEWVNNPNAYIQHFEGTSGSKSIIISNMQVGSNGSGTTNMMAQPTSSNNH